MQRHLLTAVFMLFCLLHLASAQVFVNGSFEVSTDSCRDNIPHTEVSSVIPGLFSFGNSEGIDFRANSCPLPSASNTPLAREGTQYLLFGTDNVGSDSIAIELTESLKAGLAYTLKYAHRRQAGYTSPVYHIGCSADSNSFGRYIGLGHCTNFGNTWEDTSYTFTPTQDCKYITLKSILNGELLYIDNFSIQPAGTSSVEIVSTEQNQFRLYPNPCTDHATVTLDKGVPPFRVQVSEVASARLVIDAQNVLSNEYNIESYGLSAGVYMIKLIDSRSRVFVSTLIVL